ncbi:MAG: phosphoenolpyruvate carboxykinase (ATP), partial [Planctomycetes bacterium]|nr:phosphoenolpyruvate carboxykinase (ATP) [Planctomycetota bacterium]
SGVLPPIARLTPEQAMYHFLSGYTAKVAGTEVGVKEPQASFSACFGAPFLVWHPAKYAEMLAERMERHGSHAWLVNTGWIGGRYGVGYRIQLAHTRAIIDAVHAGLLDGCATVEHPVFGLAVPEKVPGVPREVLHACLRDLEGAGILAGRFRGNFAKYEAVASREVADAGPRGEAVRAAS